jgi:hypothetical protein
MPCVASNSIPRRNFRSGPTAASEWSRDGNFALDGDSLVTVGGGFDSVLIAPLRFRKQPDDPKITDGRRAKFEAPGSFIELHSLSDTISMGIHYLGSCLMALPSN